MNRGNLVTVVIAGDYGKPRPALVVQGDAFRDLASVTVLQLTSDLREGPFFRIGVEPTPQNGLLKRSIIMVDKAVTVRRARIGKRIGCLDNDTMRRVDRALARFLGLE
ncbi:MAG: type II toxin-antitoxin system PemK/MazF family toxin [Alphaproteobacteria bacterium]